MKVTIDSKKGLKTNLKVVVDKKTIDEKIGARLNELSKQVNIKGFRPGKVPVHVLTRQFGKAVYGEVLEKRNLIPQHPNTTPIDFSKFIFSFFVKK